MKLSRCARSLSTSTAPAIERLETRCLLTAGALDTTFDGDGIVETSFPGEVLVATRVFGSAQQQDGKLVVVGDSVLSGVTKVDVSRLLVDGSLDSAFGSVGHAILSAGSGLKIAVQPDGKLVVAASGGSGGLDLYRLNADGSLDTSFDSDGVVSVPGGTAAPAGLSLLADGRIIVLHNATLFRFTTGGQLDTTFDGDGVRSVEGGSGLVVQSDGKMVVSGFAGTGFASPQFELFAIRYQMDGSLDTSFGSAGKATVAFTGVNGMYATEPALAPNGKIYLAGKVLGGFISARLNANGSLDTTFDSDGRQVTAFADDVDIKASEVQSDGKLVLFGEKHPSGYKDMLVVRYGVNGGLDATFDGDGISLVDFGKIDELNDALLQADGRLVLVGTSNLFLGITEYALTRVGAMARLSTTGSLDSDFSGDGRGRIVLTESGNGVVAPTDVAVQSDGKIVVVGQRDQSFAMSRYNIDGSLDTTFDGDGRVVTDVPVNGHGVGQGATSVAIQADGKIVVAGVTESVSTIAEGVVVRYLANGALDATFGTGGIAAVAPLKRGIQIVVDSQGRLVLSGNGHTDGPGDGTGEGYRVVRLLSNGSFDTSFDGDGVATLNLGLYSRVRDVTLQTDGKILTAGIQDLEFPKSDLAVARWLSNGGLDKTFSGDGLYTTGVGSSQREGNGIAVQPDGKVIVVGRQGQDFFSFGDLLVSRLLVDGSLDPSFGTGGILTVGVGSFVNEAKVTVQPDGKILVAVSIGNNSPLHLFRVLPGGTLDSSWGTNGDLTLPLKSGVYNNLLTTSVNAFALMPDTRIIAAGTTPGVDFPNSFRVVRVLNDDAVVTRPLDRLLTTEAGGTTTFTVRLSSPPTADVIVPLSSSDTTEGIIDASSLTFTTANWNTPQTVTITGVDDGLTDSNQPYTIVLGAATSTDANYNGKDGLDVVVRNRDNETVRFNRLYNPYANFHFFTTSAVEYENVQSLGYNDETTDRSGFALVPADSLSLYGPEFHPLYRLYNLQKGYHYYTYDTAERDGLLALNPPSGHPLFGQAGWRYEGDPGFIAVSQAAGTTVIYRLYNKVTGTHLFTESAGTRATVLASSDWEEHNPLGFAFAVASTAVPDLSFSGASGAGSTQPAVMLPMQIETLSEERADEHTAPAIAAIIPTSADSSSPEFFAESTEPPRDDDDPLADSRSPEASIDPAELDGVFLNLSEDAAPRIFAV